MVDGTDRDSSSRINSDEHTSGFLNEYYSSPRSKTIRRTRNTPRSVNIEEVIPHPRNNEQLTENKEIGYINDNIRQDTQSNTSNTTTTEEKRKDDWRKKIYKKLSGAINNDFILTLAMASVIFTVSFMFNNKNFTVRLPKENEGTEKQNYIVDIYEIRVFNVAKLIRTFGIVVIIFRCCSYAAKMTSTLAIRKISMLVQHFDSTFYDQNISLIHPLNLAYYLKSSHNTFTLFLVLIVIYIILYKKSYTPYLLIGPMTIGDFTGTCIVISGITVIKSIVIGLLNKEYSKERDIKDKIAQHILIRNLSPSKKYSDFLTALDKKANANRNLSIISFNASETTPTNKDSDDNKALNYELLSELKNETYLKFLTHRKPNEYVDFNGEIEKMNSDDKSATDRYFKDKSVLKTLNTTYERIENTIDVFPQKKELIEKSVETEKNREMEGIEREKTYLDFVKRRDSNVPQIDRFDEDSQVSTISEEQVTPSTVGVSEPVETPLTEEIESPTVTKETESPTVTKEAESLTTTKETKSLETPEIKEKEDNVSSLEIEIEDVKDENLIRKHLFNPDYYYFRTQEFKYKIKINFKRKEEFFNEDTFPLTHMLRILNHESKIIPNESTVYETTLLSQEFREIYNKFYKRYSSESKKREYASRTAKKIESLMNLTKCENLEELVVFKTASVLTKSKIEYHIPQKCIDFNTNSKNNCPKCREMEITVTNDSKCLDLYFLLTWWTSEHGNTKREQLKGALYDYISRFQNIIKNSDNMTEAIRRLDGFLWFVISLYFSAILFLKLFVDAKGSFLEVLTAVLGSSFIISSPAKSGIDCLIFLFCIHPYDVGDRVLINLNSHYKGTTSPPGNSSLHEGLENLIVKKLNIFSTIFEKFDGTELIVYNNLLMNKYIFNIGRSDHLLEIHYLQVTNNTPFEALNELREKIQKFLNSEKYFTGFLMFNYEKLEANKLFIKIFVDYKESCQDYVLYLKARNSFVDFLNATVNELKINYTENLQRILVHK